MIYSCPKCGGQAIVVGVCWACLCCVAEGCDGLLKGVDETCESELTPGMGVQIPGQLGQAD